MIRAVLPGGRETALCSYFFGAQKSTKKRAPWPALYFLSALLAWTDSRLPCRSLSEGRTASLPCLTTWTWHGRSGFTNYVLGRLPPGIGRRLSRDVLVFTWLIEWGQNPPPNRAKGKKVYPHFQSKTLCPTRSTPSGTGVEMSSPLHQGPAFTETNTYQPPHWSASATPHSRRRW